MKCVKKLFAILLIGISMGTILVSAFAANKEIPNEFYKKDTPYQQAIQKNDHHNIIKCGMEIVDLFKGKPESETVLNIVTPRLEKIAKSYEALGQYDKAVEVFKLYVPKAEKKGWKDGVTYAKAKINVLTFDIDLYTKSSDIEKNIYFKSKYEPKAGTFFGSTYDKDSRIRSYSWEDVQPYFPKKNAAYLVYLVWGQDIRGFDRYFQAAKKAGVGVELAWNIPEDNTSVAKLQNIQADAKYIRDTAVYLKELDIPVFLRFACEMNVSKLGEDPKAYISAFQYVAKTVRSYAGNVAMVWSPNDISAKDKTFAMYYPGDEYVDWVGVSTYQKAYFQGKKNWGDQQDTIDSVYMTGAYANPIARIKPFMDEYSIKKPVMISETGIEHFSKTEKEDLTKNEWSQIQLQRLYVYGPMVYPSLKGMFYFNVSMDAEASEYALYKSKTMHTLYNELVSNEYYISDINANAPFRYVKVAEYDTKETNISLMTYTIVPKVLKPTVQYKLDGKVLKAETKIPYPVTLDTTKLTKGKHELIVEVIEGKKTFGVKKYTVIISEKGTQIMLQK